MMSSKTIKFEISIKELKVSFEGDIQTAERMQSQITGAINSLASAQHRLLAPAPQAHSPAPALVEGSGGRKRRRRRASAPIGIDPAIIEGATVSSNDDGAEGDAPPEAKRRPRRTTNGNQTALITALKEDGFFAERRTIGAIKEALARKGHTFQSNELSPALVALTKAETLQRDKDAQVNQWVYFAN
jgi:hypothetical protein